MSTTCPSADLLTPCASPHARGEVVRSSYRSDLSVWTSVYPAEFHADSQTCTRLGTISQDPIGFAAGDANLYRYVGNGPVDSVDPSGLQEPGVIPLQPPPGGWPRRHPTPNIGGRPLTPDEIRQKFRNSPGSPSSYIGPYSKPFWMSYNEYSLAYIAANREGIHTQISSQLFWMLMRTPPNLPPEMAGCNATPMELYQASQLLANLYVDAVIEFLRTHHGAKPEQGSRHFILDYYGFSNEYNHPWCDDWAKFISDYLWEATQETTITVGGDECPVGNFFGIARYYWASGDLEHNYVGVKPWGYPLSEPVANDPVLLIFDPWWHLWPEVFTTGTEPLPPSGQGIRPLR